jgi:hypothetical protein
MTTTDHPSTSTNGLLPLRLRLSESAHPLDGGWWPQSPLLAVELGHLVDQFPADRGRILRAVYCPADWEDAPKRVTTARGYIEAGTFGREDKHVVVLSMSDRRKLCLVVIPSGLTPNQGAAALEASVTPYFATSPTALLDKVTEDPR